MAGDWIPIQTDLSRRREVLAISKTTGRSRYEVVGLLIEFWGWASGETEDGQIVDVYVDTLTSLVGGDCEFWNSVIKSGWLESTKTGIRIPNFDRWMSSGAKSRLRKNLRQKQWRNKPLNKGKNVGASVDTKASTTEEKRREEKNTKKTGTGTGVLSLVSQEMLADPKRVLDWFRKASTGKRKIIEPTETNKRLVVHLAQRVLRDPKVENPAACFVDCVKKKNLKMTNAEEDAAIAAITLIERGPPKERTSDLSRKSKSREQQLKEAKESPLWNGHDPVAEK